MSHINLKNFFSEVTKNKNLQERLYVTKEVSNVAQIAQELGFNVLSIEVLKAQASRLIELAVNNPDDAKIATSGKKPLFGAQWGRGGNGFLDNAGYWMIKVYDWGYSIQSYNQDILKFLSKTNVDPDFKSIIIKCKTIDDIVNVLEKSGFKISPLSLLVYQSLSILSLNNEKAELIANGDILIN